MNNTKTIHNNSHTNSLYKLEDNLSSFIPNGFPIRRLVKSSLDHEQAWISAYKADSKKYFEAVLTNQKLEELEQEELERESKVLPKRKFIKKCNFEESPATKQSKILDGFLMMHLCCVEDPLNLSVINISNKGLSQIKEEDMSLFENIIEINANENFFNFESFRNFPSLKSLNLACNVIKTIRLKHEDFFNLESLDLSFNNLSPIDVAHLGILKNLKFLKLTGNNLEFLPDTFSKLYVHTKDNKKMVSQKFPNLEELYLDNNKLREEDSFDVLSVLKKLKKLHLNKNNISCIPNLKIYRKNHVFQEFNKSYYKRKKIRQKSASSNTSLTKPFDSNLNEIMVKDLDRPSSEMNIHNSNTLRNSFILEENEDEIVEEESNTVTTATFQINTSLHKAQNSKKFLSHSVENFEKNYDLPFPELIFIDLADNQISEEDDLIALASWPMLNEIIIYGNPIVYNNIGYPPLLKQYLIDRLGINVQKIRPLKPLKNPILVPQREHRMVDSIVPKVPKMPVELKMLTYYQDPSEIQQLNRRSNLSSADSNDRDLNRHASDDASDTIGHNNFKNENLYKPFKQDKILDAFKNNYEETENNSKNYTSFFMTQVDQDDNNKQHDENTNFTKQTKQPQIKTRTKNQKHLRQRSSIDFGKDHQDLKKYEILFNIENEDQLDVPKDFKNSIRALKQMLDNPLILRESQLQLDKPQIPFRTTLKDKNLKIEKTNTQPKLAQINEILDSLKEKKTVSEINLSEALKKTEDKSQYEKAKKLLEKAQNKYEKVKHESLKSLGSAKI